MSKTRQQFNDALKLHAERNGSCCSQCTVAHCCNEPVWADKAEVAHFLKSYPPEKLPELKERTAAWLVKAQASGLLDIDNENGSEESERTGNFKVTYAWRWRAMNLPCPMLENGRCSVYADRPASCALFFAMPVPEYCGDDRRFTQSKVLEWPVFVVHGHMAAVYESIGSPSELHVDHLGVLIHNALFGTNHETKMVMKGTIEYSEDGLTVTPRQEVPA